MITRERIDELLADRALWGLAEEESHELAAGMTELGITTYDASLDVTASAITAAFIETVAEPAPEPVLRKLRGDAAAYFVRERGVELRSLGGDAERAREQPVAAEERVVPTTAARVDDASTARDPRTAGRFAWVVAAAAVLLAAWLLWERVGPEATAGARRQALLASSTDNLRIDWKPGTSPLSGKPSGDVLWNGDRQEGYMRLRGLPANDPSKRQYQLWIFDGKRDAARPVDGGLFDIPAGGGEVVIPIDAKIPVEDAVAFAVTVERPGGVVVSKREHIVVTAGL